MVVKLKYNDVLYVRNLSYVVLSDLQSERFEYQHL